MIKADLYLRRKLITNEPLYIEKLERLGFVFAKEVVRKNEVIWQSTTNDAPTKEFKDFNELGEFLFDFGGSLTKDVFGWSIFI